MAVEEIALFSLNSGQDFAELVAAHLGIETGRHEERDFEDGEHKIRPLQSVRKRDVYVIQSLYNGPDYTLSDKLVRLLFFIGALKDSGAGRLTAVVPYLCYSRKEQQTKARDPVTVRYLAQLFEAAGIDCMVTVDVHNRAAFQNAFRCQSEHLSARRPFIELLLPRLQNRKITVASPDIGGIKRAELFREELERRSDSSVASAFMEKYRSDGALRGSRIVGSVEHRTVLVVDDIIAGGGTMRRAADAFMDGGAKEVFALATHGVFTCGAIDALNTPSLSGVAVTNSIAPGNLPDALWRKKVDVIDLAPLVADVIRRLHQGGSLAELES